MNRAITYSTKIRYSIDNYLTDRQTDIKGKDRQQKSRDRQKTNIQRTTNIQKRKDRQTHRQKQDNDYTKDEQAGGQRVKYRN